MSRFSIPLVLVLFTQQCAAENDIRSVEEAKLQKEWDAVIEGIADQETKRQVVSLVESGQNGTISINSAKKGEVGKLASLSTISTARPSSVNPRVWVMGPSIVKDTYFRVDNVVDKRNMLISDFRAWIQGVDTSDIIDDSNHDFSPYTFECVGTKTYETEDSTRTVRHFVLIDPGKINPILKELAEIASYRAWLDKEEKHAITAKFIDFKNGKVLLETKEGKGVAVKVTQLSKEDQRWVKDAIR